MNVNDKTELKKYEITVFTPAYNRGYIIEKLYRSLQRQTYKDFEWVVVDDGSVDDTQKRIDDFIKEENAFPIRYIKTENGGKHRAINKGLEMSCGKLFFIVDSDDYLTDDALECIAAVEQSIPENKKKNFAGVCGLKAYSLEKPIGTSFPGEYLDITSLDRLKHNITGDKAEAFYTDILRKYPFPTFEGEKFVTECVVWDRMASDGYKLRFYNRISIICNYLDDGLSARGYDLYFRNPRGYALYLQQSSRLKRINGVEKCNSYVGFYEELCKSNTFYEISNIFQMNPVHLWIKLFAMRVYRRLFEGRDKNDS